ncbi:MAG: fibronectin type III domain-containing protein [bacterium]|nr:fibronectin type III domain-containing protein [bacterium]
MLIVIKPLFLSILVVIITTCGSKEFDKPTELGTVDSTLTNPFKPGNLHVSGSGNRTRLTWDAPENYTDVEGYRIERNVNNGSWSVVEENYVFKPNPLPYIFYNDKDLTPGMTYYYRVAAMAGGIRSEYTNISSVKLIGNVYYVSSDGNDAFNGTSPVSAWRTVDKANGARSAGDLVLFRKGDTFSSENVFIQNIGNGTKKNPVTWSSYGNGSRPKFSGSVSQLFVLSVRDVDNWIFEGLHFEGSKWQTFQIRAANDDVTGIKILDCYIVGPNGDEGLTAAVHLTESGASVAKTSLHSLTDVEIAYSEILNSVQSGIGAWAVTAGLHVHNNYIHNYGYGPESGSQIDVNGGSGHIVEYNVLRGGSYTNPKGSGTKCHGQQHRMKNMIYRGNLIYFMDGFGLSLQDSRDGLVENNTVFNGNFGYAAFSMRGKNHPEDIGGNIVRNNIFVGARNSEGAVRITISDSNDDDIEIYQMGYPDGDDWRDKVDFDDNLIFEGEGYIVKYVDDIRNHSWINSHDDWVDNWGTFFPNDIHADPLFLNVEEGDFRLHNDSPASGLGVPLFMLD